jgi:hypothetical protein
LAAKTAWYANANDIAAFLNAANPTQWPLSETQQMLKSHLDLTLQDAVDRLVGKYQDHIHDYELVRQQILGIADVLGIGIINQFPTKFLVPDGSCRLEDWDDFIKCVQDKLCAIETRYKPYINEGR